MSTIPARRISTCSCAAELAALRAELADLRAIVDELVAATPYQRFEAPASASVPPTAGTERERVARERVALFRSLFVGRDDVYAQRWEKEDGRKGWSPQIDRHSGQTWQEARDAHQYRPLTDDVLRDHLSGKITAGLYPMLPDDTCRLLVCDFDGDQWRLDAQAYVQAAQTAGVPVALEISRSGEGAHVWAFFREPVPALDARALGFGLLREAMAVRGELGLDSYDRFFPSQDHLPVKGEGLGNLIALPLQRRCRDAGTTVFVDPETFTAYEDQWAFLTGVDAIDLASPADRRSVAPAAEAAGLTVWLTGERFRPILRLAQGSGRSCPAHVPGWQYPLHPIRYIR
jgi:hypothetical protein